jgi:cobalt-zinc-cadmium efflux system outer membrane protein
MLQAGELDIGMARAEHSQAGLWPNPELSVEVEGVGGSGAWRRLDGAETTIAISQPMALAGKVKKRQRVALARVHQTEQAYARQRREMRARTAKAFYAVLAAQEKQILSQQNLKAAQKLYRTVVQRVTAGKDSPIKETQAAVTVSEQRLALQQAENQLALARRQLALLWGADASEYSRASGDFTHIRSVPSAERVLAQCDTHPATLQWQASVAEAEAEVALAKADPVPDITLTGGYKRYEDQGQDTAVLGLALPLPLFNRNQGAKERATLALGRTRRLQRQAEVSLFTTLKNRHQRLTLAAAQAKTLQDEILPRVVEAYQASITAYEQGKFDYLETLEAQRELFTMKNRVLDALTQYHEAHADLEALIGPFAQTNNNPNEEGL